MFGRYLFALCALLFIGFAPHAAAVDYEGEDGGYLIYSVGTVAIPMNFAFDYRGLAPAPGSRQPWRGRIECRCVGFFRAEMADPDFRGRETGKVVVQRLPPGDYQIYNFGFGGSVGGMITTYSSREPFVIPFTIRSGEATYIGSFLRAPSLGTSLEPELGANGFFIVADRSERDLAVLTRRRPELPMPTISVTDVSTFGHPAMRSAEP